MGTSYYNAKNAKRKEQRHHGRGLQSREISNPSCLIVVSEFHWILSVFARKRGCVSGRSRNTEMAALVNDAKTAANPGRIVQCRSSCHQRSFTKCIVAQIFKKHGTNVKNFRIGSSTKLPNQHSSNRKTRVKLICKSNLIFTSFY